MKNSLLPPRRLFVALDLEPIITGGQIDRKELINRAKEFVRLLKGTGVGIKINSVLRAAGYDLIDFIHDLGHPVFADLKLYDIGKTLATDGELLRSAKPEFLTVASVAGHDAMSQLMAQLPETDVLAVTVLTNIENEEASKMFPWPTVLENVAAFARKATAAGVDGVICAPAEIKTVRGVIAEHMSINTPAIRPLWSFVAGDDQRSDRVMTPAKAIQAGATRIIVGRPILNDPKPYDAVMRTIEEIAVAAGTMPV